MAVLGIYLRLCVKAALLCILYSLAVTSLWAFVQVVLLQQEYDFLGGWRLVYLGMTGAHIAYYTANTIVTYFIIFYTTARLKMSFGEIWEALLYGLLKEKREFWKWDKELVEKKLALGRFEKELGKALENAFGRRF
jgi:hypothetical protein